MATIPYVIRSGEIIFQPGVPLTIGAGAVIKLSNPGGVSRLNLLGPLTVLGTSTAPVVFTSLRDSTFGGVTNLFEGNVGPAPGNWRSVILNGTGSSGSQLNHAIFRYGGAGDGADLWVDGSTGTVFTNGEASFSNAHGILENTGGSMSLIQGSTFKGNTQWGAVLDGASGSINGNLFDGNGTGGINFQGGPGAPAMSGNTFQNNAVLMQIASPNIYLNDQGGNVLGAGNQMAGIDILASVWTQGGTWNMATIPYVIRSGEIIFQPGVPLTIGAGAVIKLSNPGGVSRLNLLGPLTVLGTSTAPVVFTSLRDSTFGGVTNLFEGNVGPAPGNWRSVILNGTGSSGSQLNHAIFRYGGAGDGANLWSISNSSGSITSCEISSSSANGILLSGASPLISGSTIKLNAQAGISANSQSLPEIHSDIITGNGTFGVLNNDPTVNVNAQFNYWGSTTGPTSVSNPGGTGDRVSAHVNFIPFLTSPPGIASLSGT